MLQDLAVASPADFSLAAYDRALLGREMELFPEWFCEGMLGLASSSEMKSRFEALQEHLCDRALAQTQVVVHRDFHARNLMLLDDGSLATIDFQDAVWGPLTYDPVSLLKDCYLRWPDVQVREWALMHRAGLSARGVTVPDEREFLVDFDFMGLQRHLKVLGIFARLFLRDGKPGYLGDLPRVMAYVQSALASYPDVPVLAEFADWFERALMPAARTQAWFHEYRVS